MSAIKQALYLYLQLAIQVDQQDATHEQGQQMDYKTVQNHYYVECQEDYHLWMEYFEGFLVEEDLDVENMLVK